MSDSALESKSLSRVDLSGELLDAHDGMRFLRNSVTLSKCDVALDHFTASEVVNLVNRMENIQSEIYRCWDMVTNKEKKDEL